MAKVNWTTIYNRAPGPVGRVVVLMAAGAVAQTADLIEALRELRDRGAVHCDTERDERA